MSVYENLAPGLKLAADEYKKDYQEMRMYKEFDGDKVVKVAFELVEKWAQSRRALSRAVCGWNRAQLKCMLPEFIDPDSLEDEIHAMPIDDLAEFI